MPQATELDLFSLPPKTVYALEAAAHARSRMLRARNTDQSNTARAIEESIREGLLGETMLSPNPAYSEHIYRRGRELAGLPPLQAKGETMMVNPDENGLEPDSDEEIQGSE